MKKLVYLLIPLMVISLFLAFSNSSLAEEEMEYSWGIVSDISFDKLILSEYDYDTDSELEVSYSIASDIELVNVDSVEEITIGDALEIEYVIAGNKNMAKVITVETEEDVYVPLETYDEGYELLSEEKESEEE
ncbi:hypothetical protein ACFL28_03715 [Candidatus Omnitrophota bacterium]